MRYNRGFYRRSSHDILQSSISLGTLANSNPELFNFDRLTTPDKINLCLDYPTLAPHLKLTPDDKVTATIQLSADQLKKCGLLADKKDILSSSDRVYVTLVEKNKTYFDLKRYQECSERAKGQLFALVPKKVLDGKQPVPRLISSSDMASLSRSNAWLFKDGHITNFSVYTTDDRF